MYFVENRNGFRVPIVPLLRMVSPNGPYSYWAEAFPLVALTKPERLPFPSKAAKCTPFDVLLMAMRPPTPPAPCVEPLTSNPQMKERTTALLLALSSATRFQPS